jgi:phenylpropionate dioxygenase-like ring-hydroxylating dioxygenase large terminal subunit
MSTIPIPATDDQSVIERVLAHIRNRTTDLGTEVWREPVENYRSEARYAAELALLRRLPVPYCPSAALPEAGSFLARTAAGIPLLVVRDAEGTVRAYRNACRHRGMEVASGSGCRKAFACRYHGWTYGLDGRLRQVPHEAGFPGLDKSLHGLVPVSAVERDGLVYIAQNGALSLSDELPPILAAGHRMFSEAETLVEANWKIFTEGFIEGYHIRSTHPESFLPYGFDNLNVIDFFGRHSRVTYPFRRIRKLENIPAAQRRVSGYLTYVYHLFPNVIIAVLSSHTKLVVLEPVSVSKTRMLTWSLTNSGDEGAEDEARRDAAFVNDTGGAEDREVVRAIQRGLSSGANEAFTFGQYESAIVHFHRALESALGLPRPATSSTRG